MKEIEVKILDFDEKSLRENLKKAGAKYGGKVEQKRVVFDATRFMITKESEFFRVRTDGKKTTLAWKHRDEFSGRIDNTEEIEVEVSDFDKTVDIISKPNECIFIDDMQENVDAAKRLGIAAVRFTTLAKLKKDLARLGIA